MLGCDIIVAEEHATFALPEIKVGVLPDSGVVKLRRRIPYHVAVDLMMTGRWMEAFAVQSLAHAVAIEGSSQSLLSMLQVWFPEPMRSGEEGTSSSQSYLDAML